MKKIFMTFMILISGAYFLPAQLVDGVDVYNYTVNVARKTVSEPDWVEQQEPIRSNIKIWPKEVIGRLDPNMIGFNIEDINHAFYPGLYAQMLWDESFEDEPNQPLPKGWDWHAEPLNHDTPRDDENLRRWRSAWAFENGAVYLAGCRQRRIFTDLFRSDNALIEVEMMQHSLDQTGYWGPNLLFCWGDSEYLLLQVSYDRKMVELRRGDDKRGINVSKTLAYTDAVLPFDKWIKFEIEAKREGEITVSMDGKQILTYKGKPLPEGGLGLDATFTNAWFRNLKARKIDGGSWWVADFKHIDHKPYEHNDHLSKWWFPVEDGSANGEFKWIAENPYNTNRSQMMRLRSGKGMFGMSNSGLRNWGLTVKKEYKYTGRLYIRGDRKAEPILALQNKDGSKTYARQRLSGIGQDWKRFDFELTSKENDTTARFAILLDQPSEIYVDQVVLLPDERDLYKGLPIRRDIAEKLLSGISHLRFGGDMINQKGFAGWKHHLLSQDKRRQYLDGWSYHKSAQFMIFEFLEFCEVAGIEALPNFDAVPAKEVAEFVEYCNGDANTFWGKKRIENGRKEPYKIKYVMIGNGMPTPEEVAETIEAVKQVDPGVKLFTGDLGHTAQYMVDNIANRPFDKFTAKDIHSFGSRPEVGFLGDGEAWRKTLDTYRNFFPEAVRSGIKLYAEEVNGHSHNWQRGLCDALFTMVSEQNFDIVSWQSFCNAAHASGNLYEWDQGHIFYTSSRSWYQPSGWVVKLFGENFQTDIVRQQVNTSDIEVYAGQGIHENVRSKVLTSTATISPDGKNLIVKVVNLYPGEVKTNIMLNDVHVQGLETITMGTLHLKAENSADNPFYIVPESNIVLSPQSDMEYSFEPMSFTILKYRLQ